MTWSGDRGARHLPWLALETTPLAPAEVPQWCSLQGWTLLCSGKDEVAVTKVTRMAAMMAMTMTAGMLLQ